MSNNDRTINGSVKVEGRVEAIPKEIIASYLRSAKDDGVREDKRFKLEKITLASVLTVAGLTLLQTYLTLESLQAARAAIDLSSKQFAADQRPYILLKKVWVYDTTIGKRAEVNVAVANYGKSPALHITSKDHVFIGPDAQAQVELFFSVLPTVHGDTTDGSMSTLPPNNPECKEYGDEGCHVTTALSGGPIANMEQVGATDGDLVVAGRIFYRGMNPGEMYYTDYCERRLVSGSMSQCSKHNEVH